MQTPIVLPGDILAPAFTNNLKLGPGLQQLQGVGTEPIIIATRAGALRNTGRNKYLVESNSQRVCI